MDISEIKSYFTKGMAIMLFITTIVISSYLNVSAETKEEERRRLEAELSQIEGQIKEYETTVNNYQVQGRGLQTEIDRLNANIKKLNLQLQATNLSIGRLDSEIKQTEEKIDVTEKQINLNKNALGESLRSIYESGNDSMVMILLKNPSLSTFFSDVEDLLLVQDRIRTTMEKITVLRDELLLENEELSLERTDVTALKAYQVSQQLSLKDTKGEKNTLLKVTKGQESRYQTLLKEKQKTAAQIRSRIFEFLGGGQLTFEEALKFAKVAESATGVRAAFILAVLDRESALGQNVGRCSYKTAMHPKRDIPIFLEITKELNLNPDSMFVSCANRDGAYGGAMGPAQFIPSTWVLYKDKIAAITGNDPASPWRNSDAFMATAIYMKDLLNACGEYSGLAKERCAAARYYAGRRFANYLWTYGDRVVTKAEQFQKDINVLNS